MVEIFKTNVQEMEQSELLLRHLLAHFPENKINFDLEDCDKILRVEGEFISQEKIIELLVLNGCQCKALD
jgi:hypothetical protein